MTRLIPKRDINTEHPSGARNRGTKIGNGSGLRLENMRDAKHRTSEREYVAHVRRDANGTWAAPHLLDSHLKDVAALAERFAAAFGNSDWGHLAGLWHDLGKYKAAFQDYIRTVSGYERDEAEDAGPGKVDHTTAGAIHAVKTLGASGRILAYLIAGHHAGLPDWVKQDAPGRGLSERLQDVGHLTEALLANIPNVVLAGQPPKTIPCGAPITPDHFHLWVRMLFSCLVDADFLDTELYMDDGLAALRAPAFDLSTLRARYDEFMRTKQERSADSPLNRIRRKILDDCRAGASKAPGLFSLTVPTGGGKTLASIGFALDHAIAHNKRRIIVAIPYTSIIEQTAEVLRDVFGDDAVLEHHSNLDPERETRASKLATENWDAPIVVTTNVQLFESLFAARTSACRKLHNIVNSVVILDEAQMLPPEFLKPILNVLDGLTKHFGVSALLCTATQPALEGHIGDRTGLNGSGGFPGLKGVRELMPDRDALAAALRRIRIEVRGTLEEATSWEDIAADVRELDQVLCIVNTRRDCRELHALLPDGTIHLSALMCGEHRSRVIADIKQKLSAGQPTRVVSTQLVEAGVDVDFPVVYRAMSGLDSIAQAGGRCNREGRLPDGQLGRVVVFAPPRRAPIGLLRKGEDAGLEMFRCHPDIVGALSPDAFRKYFQTFYRKVSSFDAARVLELLTADGDSRECKFQFRTAARRFKLIDDAGQKPIIVWYASNRFDSRDLIERLKRFGPDRKTMRRLQRCTVNVPVRAWNDLKAQGAIVELTGPDGPLELWVQALPGLYDETFGLRLEGPTFSGDEFVC